jgi:hypothetical protein
MIGLYEFRAVEILILAVIGVLRERRKGGEDDVGCPGRDGR